MEITIAHAYLNPTKGIAVNPHHSGAPIAHNVRASIVASVFARSRKTRMRVPAVLPPLAALLLFPPGVFPQDLFTWSPPRTVVPGTKCDVIASSGGTIHLITRQYYQFDADGNEITSESHGDNSQGARDDGPSIDIGPDGKIYELTKAGGGDNTHPITFRLRSPDGSIERELKASDGLRDNRTMAIWAGKNGEAYWMHSNNVGWPDPPDHYDMNHITAGGNTVLGDLLFHSTQIDFVCDGARSGDIIAASMGGRSECSYTWADISKSDIAGQMRNNRVVHKPPSGWPGWPALYTDGKGDVHLVYGGSEGRNPEHAWMFYNRYSGGTEKVYDNDVLAMEGWPHRTIPAIATSDDGATIVCVGPAGVHNNGWENNAVLVFCYSTDGGESWSAKDTIDGTKVDTDEGFRRPRMAGFGNRIYLFFNQMHDNHISLTMMDVGEPASGAIGRSPSVAASKSPHRSREFTNLLGRTVGSNGMNAAAGWFVVQGWPGRTESSRLHLHFDGIPKP